MTNYGRNMALARDAKRLTQRQAAEKLGISQGYLGGIEIGRNQPDTWPLLANMAQVYGVTTDQLLGLIPSSGEVVRETNDLLNRLSPARYREVMEIAKLFLLLDSQEYRTEVMEDLIVGSEMFDRGRVIELLNRGREVGSGLGIQCLGLPD